jgi:hypothetical protein
MVAVDWREIKRTDYTALRFFQRHYSCKNIWPTSLCPPGESFCLALPDYSALWCMVKCIPEYVMHAWPDRISCTVFRNESVHRSSDLIYAALALTQFRYGNHGLVTFVDDKKVRSKNPGYCFKMAGWKQEKARTKSGLVVLTYDYT